MLAHADGDPAARGGNVGAVGFCMSGGLALALARALPERVAAAASIHGARLVRDTDDSPHRGLDTVRAEVYFAWCDNDATAPPETIPVMREALDDGGRALHARLHRLRRPRLRPARHRALQPPGVRAALGARPLPPAPQPLVLRSVGGTHRVCGTSTPGTSTSAGSAAWNACGSGPTVRTVTTALLTIVEPWSSGRTSYVTSRSMSVLQNDCSGLNDGLFVWQLEHAVTVVDDAHHLERNVTGVLPAIGVRHGLTDLGDRHARVVGEGERDVRRSRRPGARRHRHRRCRLGDLAPTNVHA